MMEVVFTILRKQADVIFNTPELMSIPSQVRFLHGFQIDFSLLGTKPDFIKVSWKTEICIFMFIVSE